MNDDENTKKTSRLIGFVALGLSFMLYAVFVLVMFFMMTDTYIFWAWWWALVIVAGIIGTAVVTFLLKGLIGLVVNVLLFLVILVCIFLQYWFRTERVLVLGSMDDAVKKFSVASAEEFSTSFFDKHPRRILIFVGDTGEGAAKPKSSTESGEKGEGTQEEAGGEDSNDKDKASISVDDLKKAIKTNLEKASKEKDKKIHTIELDDKLKYKPGETKNAKNVVDAVSKTKYSSQLKEGVIEYPKNMNFGAAFKEGEGTKKGITVEKLASDYKIEKKEKTS